MVLGSEVINAIKQSQTGQSIASQPIFTPTTLTPQSIAPKPEEKKKRSGGGGGSSSQPIFTPTTLTPQSIAPQPTPAEVKPVEQPKPTPDTTQQQYTTAYLIQEKTINRNVDTGETTGRIEQRMRFIGGGVPTNKQGEIPIGVSKVTTRTNYKPENRPIPNTITTRTKPEGNLINSKEEYNKRFGIVEEGNQIQQLIGGASSKAETFINTINLGDKATPIIIGSSLGAVNTFSSVLAHPVETIKGTIDFVAHPIKSTRELQESFSLMTMEKGELYTLSYVGGSLGASYVISAGATKGFKKLAKVPNTQEYEIRGIRTTTNTNKLFISTQEGLTYNPSPTKLNLIPETTIITETGAFRTFKPEIIKRGLPLLETETGAVLPGRQMQLISKPFDVYTDFQNKRLSELSIDTSKTRLIGKSETIRDMNNPILESGNRLITEPTKQTSKQLELGQTIPFIEKAKYPSFNIFEAEGTRVLFPEGKTTPPTKPNLYLNLFTRTRGGGILLSEAKTELITEGLYQPSELTLTPKSEISPYLRNPELKATQITIPIISLTTKQEGITSNIQKQGLTTTTTNSLININKLDTSTKELTLTATKTAVLTDTLTKTKQSTRTKTIQLTETIQKTQQEVIQEPILITETIQEQRKIKKIKPKEEIIKPIIFSPLSQAKEQKKQGGLFKVEVRKRGLFETIGTAPTFSLAFEKGKRAVEQTASASFRIKGGFGGSLSSKFRQSTREEGVFIQKSRYRITSPGEKKEIPGKARFINRKNKARGFKL